MNYDITPPPHKSLFLKKIPDIFAIEILIISIFLYRALLIKEINIVQKRQGLFIPLELLISGVWIQSDKKQWNSIYCFSIVTFLPRSLPVHGDC